MTPEQWRDHLMEKLGAQLRDWVFFDRYYRGDHPLPDAPKGTRGEYLRLMRLSRSNWMELVVDAVNERLYVDGFRFGNTAMGDMDVWAGIWQPNGLDAESGTVHLEALVGGAAFVLVWPDEEFPSITPEHPTEMVVAVEPGSRRERSAALKHYYDDDMELVCLWLPDVVYKWAKAKDAFEWLPYRDDDDPSWPLPNPFGVVPVVEFPNKARMIGAGRSELAAVTEIQDRVNETLFNRLVAQRFASFRQRWVTGMEIPLDPETNQPVEPFKAAIDRLWMAEDGEVKFGEFEATDLAPYIKSVESDIQHLAAITRTPPHYLLGQSGAFPSGESLKATETGLVAKVRQRQRTFGERWEEVIRLALQAMGDPRAVDTSCQVIWANPESRSEGELVDALLKMQTLGVPNEALWERWGASPQEIARWRAMEVRTSLAASLGQPQPTRRQTQLQLDATGRIVGASAEDMPVDGVPA